MATDRLVQVGKFVAQNRNDIDVAQRRYAENLPLVERLRDSFDPDHSFFCEFITTHVDNNILVTFTFMEAFQVTC